MIRLHAVCAALSAVLFLGACLPAGAAESTPEQQAVKAAGEWVEPFPVKGKVTVVDFGATWCASCPEMEQLMREMQKEYGDRAAFVTVDIDQYPGIDDKYLVEQMPSQLFYDAEGEPIWMHKGELDAETLRDRVDILLAGPQKPAE